MTKPSLVQISVAADNNNDGDGVIVELAERMGDNGSADSTQ